MNKLITYCALCMFFIIGCSNIRILDQTNDTIIIESAGGSQTEAEINAIKKGREIFGNVEKIRDSECSQEFVLQSGDARTFWKCIVHLKKSK